MKASFVRGEPGALDLHPTKGANRHTTVRFAAPRTAPVLKLDHFFWGCFDKELYGVLVREPIAAANSVLEVFVETVIVFDHRSSATLCGHSVAAHRVYLANDCHAERRIGLSDGYGRAESCSTTADDYDVMPKAHVGRRPCPCK